MAYLSLDAEPRSTAAKIDYPRRRRRTKFEYACGMGAECRQGAASTCCLSHSDASVRGPGTAGFAAGKLADQFN